MTSDDLSHQAARKSREVLFALMLRDKARVASCRAALEERAAAAARSAVSAKVRLLMQLQRGGGGRGGGGGGGKGDESAEMSAEAAAAPEIIPAGMVRRVELERRVELQLVQSELSALASTEWASAVLGFAKALWRERRVERQRRVEREPLEASADAAPRASAPDPYLETGARGSAPSRADAALRTLTSEPPPPLHVSDNQWQSVEISGNRWPSLPTLHVSDKAARAAIYALLKRPPLSEVLTTQADAETLAIRICGGEAGGER